RQQGIALCWRCGLAIHWVSVAKRLLSSIGLSLAFPRRIRFANNLPNALHRGGVSSFTSRRLSIMKRLCLTLVAFSILASASCAEDRAVTTDKKTVATADGKNPVVVIDTSMGTIKVEL